MAKTVPLALHCWRENRSPTDVAFESRLHVRLFHFHKVNQILWTVRFKTARLLPVMMIFGFQHVIIRRFIVLQNQMNCAIVYADIYKEIGQFDNFIDYMLAKFCLQFNTKWPQISIHLEERELNNTNHTCIKRYRCVNQQCSSITKR